MFEYRDPEKDYACQFQVSRREEPNIELYPDLEKMIKGPARDRIREYDKEWDETLSKATKGRKCKEADDAGEITGDFLIREVKL